LNGIGPNDIDLTPVFPRYYSPGLPKDDIITFLRDAGYEVHVDHGENHLGMLYAKNTHFTKEILAYSPEKAQ
jgi:hypothetical protein